MNPKLTKSFHRMAFWTDYRKQRKGDGNKRWRNNRSYERSTRKNTPTQVCIWSEKRREVSNVLVYNFLCRCEIDAIEQKVMKERERYQQATQSKSDGLSAIPFISVNDKVIFYL